MVICDFKVTICYSVYSLMYDMTKSVMIHWFKTILDIDL